jgi:hypothetical protein
MVTELSSSQLLSLNFKFTYLNLMGNDKPII